MSAEFTVPSFQRKVRDRPGGASLKETKMTKVKMENRKP